MSDPCDFKDDLMEKSKDFEFACKFIIQYVKDCKEDNDEKEIRRILSCIVCGNEESESDE